MSLPTQTIVWLYDYMTLWTNDTMAAIALSKSTSYPFSLSHNISATSLTYPPVQTQDKRRLLSPQQQNLGWEDPHQFYLGWSWKVCCLQRAFFRLLSLSANPAIFAQQLKFVHECPIRMIYFLTWSFHSCNIGRFILTSFRKYFEIYRRQFAAGHRNLKLRVENSSSEFLESSSIIISHETFLF